ncbi:MAG: CBS domain-containing protein, partial [Chloroflexi bacterium]|nr:CBS domain-containing protein [Chloroflexota bacterium]
DMVLDPVADDGVHAPDPGAQTPDGGAQRPDPGAPVDGGAPAGGVTLEERTTLKDALSIMLAAGVDAAVVTDGAGRPVGMLTVAAIAARMREGTDGAGS